MNNNMEKEIFDIYLDDIIPNRFQPRLTFDEKSLNELADSIRQHGIIQPLVVRKIGDKYEIIAGERRYKASQIAGLSKVPAVIMNLNDSESAQVAVIENTQRKDLSALEEAESYKKLLDKGYSTQEQLASRMGKTQATISNKLRLLALTDEVKEALLNEKISERHARSLLSLKDPNAQIDVLNKVMNNKMTVRQTDELIKSMMGGEVVEKVEIPEQNNSIDQSPTSSLQPEGIPFIPNFSVPEVPIKTPVVEPVAPLIIEDEEPKEEIVIDSVSTGFDPIRNIDINQVKEEAVDINPAIPPTDVNVLLGTNAQPAENLVQGSENIVEKARFITQFPEEELDENQEEAPLKQEDTPLPIAVAEEPVSEVPVYEQPITPIAVPEQPPLVESSPILQSEPINSATVSEIPEEAVLEEPKEEPTTNTDSLIQEFRQENTQLLPEINTSSGDVRVAINSVRDLIRNLEKNNFKIDVEEFDFETAHQMIIKIEK